MTTAVPSLFTVTRAQPLVAAATGWAPTVRRCRRWRRRRVCRRTAASSAVHVATKPELPAARCSSGCLPGTGDTTRGVAQCPPGAEGRQGRGVEAAGPHDAEGAVGGVRRLGSAGQYSSPTARRTPGPAPCRVRTKTPSSVRCRHPVDEGDLSGRSGGELGGAEARLAVVEVSVAVQSPARPGGALHLEVRVGGDDDPLRPDRVTRCRRWRRPAAPG